MPKKIMIALVLGLAGCANQAAQPPVATVQSQMRPDAVVPPASGVTVVSARAFVTEGGVAREVQGARCDLTSPYSTATFIAPSTVSVPDLGAQTPVLRISCSDGAHSGVTEVRATLVAGNGGGGPVPMIGISVGTGGGNSGVGVGLGGVWGGGGSGAGVQRAVYPEARVMMR